MRITFDLSRLGKANPGKPTLLTENWTHTLHFPDSSNISSARYNATEGVLEVSFRNGGTYRYRGVPVSVYEGFVLAPSAGRFFHSQIKKRFPTSRDS